MKKIFLLALIIAPAFAFAQTVTLQTFFDKYAGREGFTTVKISPKMFDLIASADIDEEGMEVIKDITGVNVLTYEMEEGKSSEMADKLYAEAKSLINSGYEELMSVKEDDTDLRILAKSPGNGVINDLLIVGKDDGDFVYVSVTGKIDIKKISELSKCTDVKGLQHLKDLDEDDEKK